MVRTRNIFRPAALERLSTPERLDQAAQIATSKDWLAVVGFLVLAVATAMWAFTGSISTKAPARGVIIRHSGVMNVVAAGSGLVLAVQVASGDRVTDNQVVARIAQPALLERIRLAEVAVADARAERDRLLPLRQRRVTLDAEAVTRQRENAEREMSDLRAQVKALSEQIPVYERLLERGLITRQQTLEKQQAVAALEARIAAAGAQVKQFDAQLFGLGNQPKDLEIEFENRIAQSGRTLASLNKELGSAAEVASPYAGRVIELKVYRGSAVTEGSPILSVELDAEGLEALMYVDALRAKEIRPGMEVQITPGTVRREESGFLRGRVTFVASYPATRAAMMRNLENEALASSLSASGPVTELRVELEKADTPSGLRWSSREGPALDVTSGTLSSAEIITARRRPIDLIWPTIGANR